MRVEMRPVGELVPYHRNPRRNEAAIAKVAASLAEYGWKQPVVVDSALVVIVGHTRLAAAKSLGMTEVPVLVASDLTPAQAKAYRLADNRSGDEAEWDDSLLRLELADLQDVGFDLALTAFNQDELNVYLDEAQLEGAGGGGEQRGKLTDRFGVAPFSVLSAREGWWQDRKRAWIALGIKSELGRGEGNECAPGGGGGIWGHRGPSKFYDGPKPNATPGGHPMPATNYGKTRARGDGRGRAMPKAAS